MGGSIETQGDLGVSDSSDLEDPETMTKLPWNVPEFTSIINTYTGRIGMIVHNPGRGVVLVNYDGKMVIERIKINYLRLFSPEISPSHLGCGCGLQKKQCVFFGEVDGEPVCHRYTSERMQRLLNNHLVAERCPTKSPPWCQLPEKITNPGPRICFNYT